MPFADSEITNLLRRIGAGDQAAENDLMSLVYLELCRLAARQMSAEARHHTLQATALVNEAYMRMLGPIQAGLKDRAHFFSIAAQTMRRILVDHARARVSAKRGGKSYRVELQDGLAVTTDQHELVLAVDEALKRLGAQDPRQQSIVEMRFFGGMTDEEIGLALGISTRTVRRDWDFAKAWLRGEIAGGA